MKITVTKTDGTQEIHNSMTTNLHFVNNMVVLNIIDEMIEIPLDPTEIDNIEQTEVANELNT